MSRAALTEALLDVERREAARVIATSLQPGLALAIGCGRLSIDARDERPNPDDIGKVVMLESLSKIVGCAKLAGVITLDGGARWPGIEHPQWEQILAGIQGKLVDRACLWVFESGVLFDPPIQVRAGSGSSWIVPRELHAELRAAYAAAMKRRAQ